jgi:23S rRNA (cytosine1962-C5)-methyltransferase
MIRQPLQTPPLKLRLAKDLVRSLKRGQPWVFAEALRHLPPAAPGSPAILLDNKKGREIAQGFYDPHSPLAFRVCSLEPGQPLNQAWAEQRLDRARQLRRPLFGASTTGFRLINGEGDGLPGLICDIYDRVAVLQLDGAGPAGFWHSPGLAEWLAQTLTLSGVYLQSRQGQGRLLGGELPAGPIPFLENGIQFTADIRHGQKTGFFLDQRENRQRIREVATGRRMLNVFGYTGGFSVYAGLAGARQVITLDLAGPALAMAQTHWQLNGLPPDRHEIRQADAFKFLQEAGQKRQRWELVVVDPPSFAPAKALLPQAQQAYQSLIAAAATVTTADGLLAVASCSSHVTPEMFLSFCEQGISLARRRAIVLSLGGQPADHPTPLAFPEFRYLKFVLLRVE